MTGDPFLEYRPVLLDEVRRSVDEVPLHHGAVMRQKLVSAGEHDASLLPGLLCLHTGSLFPAGVEPALPAAIALSLLSGMAQVFAMIGLGEDDEGLLRGWGMPRVLNAGDGLFALAHHTLNQAPGLDTRRRFDAMDLLDSACARVSEGLFRSGSNGLDVRLGTFPAALGLGALAGGADSAIVGALAALDLSQDRSIPAILPPETSEKLSAALGFAMESGR